jgi:uncharacterized protein (TIGR03118 family)
MKPSITLSASLSKRSTHSFIKSALLIVAAIVFTAASTRADPATFNWTNLQSDIAGVARRVDSNLINPWGMAVSSNGIIWVSDNGTGVSTLYSQNGTPVPNAANPLVVAIPASASNTEGANPTGIVFNDTPFFKVTKGGSSQPSVFIFVSEDGMISGWNPQLDLTHAIVAKDNGGRDAVYKGTTLGMANGHNFLFVTNFQSGQVETFNENFQRVNLGGFVDPNIPADYAPFGIRNFNGQVFVTYAKRNPANPDDDLAGPGFGFVDVFDTSGNLLRRLVSHGRLNAPWGLAMVQGTLWVGNFGNGRINAYDPATGNFLGTLKATTGNPLAFDGLWDLLPIGNQIFFTAGIADEEHGLFGVISQVGQ